MINGVGFFCKLFSFQEPAEVHLQGRLLGLICGLITGLGHYSYNLRDSFSESVFRTKCPYTGSDVSHLLK